MLCNVCCACGVIRVGNGTAGGSSDDMATGTYVVHTSFHISTLCSINVELVVVLLKIHDVEYVFVHCCLTSGLCLLCCVVSCVDD